MTDPAVGEAWAYRARGQDPLVQVAVLRVGVKTPRRLLVRFVDDEFEGRQEWVPPARLKAPWSEADAFIARERRWDAVAAGTPGHDDAAVSAAGVVFDLLIKPELATVGYNATEGVITIHDVDGLATFLHVDPQELRSDPVSFEEDGALVSILARGVAGERALARRSPKVGTCA